MLVSHKKLKKDFDKTSKLVTAQLEKTKTKDQQINTYRDYFDVLKEENGRLLQTLVVEQ